LHLGTPAGASGDKMPRVQPDAVGAAVAQGVASVKHLDERVKASVNSTLDRTSAQTRASIYAVPRPALTLHSQVPASETAATVMRSGRQKRLSSAGSYRWRYLWSA
jgi:hypothetical protein